MERKLKIGIGLLVLVIVVPFLSVLLCLNTSEGCLNCSDGCEYFADATEKTQQYQELANVSKKYVSQKEGMDIDFFHDIIQFKSDKEAVVTVLSDSVIWNGTWTYSNGKWKPKSDFCRE
ncbi:MULTISPECIES: hypothetical protein [Methanobacterium]|jgi:hypothetical protein|uniref:Uncharacterized protein n=1 Tax=Methanobacterium bryantii TaxID=2161 RepID=A0A2A2H9A2_METBR|nr:MULTISPECIES: hypothetical protein [Methanobacterium]OEC86907.1 hypothetical protein A9507_08310 [Methanobacterium sp. A39]PAV05967.1 hypothetical protein ASJ80_14050 [Methanobacterium bryantii]